MANALSAMMPRPVPMGVDPTRRMPVPGMETSTAVAPAPMPAPQTAPRSNALAMPMGANFNPPKPKQQNMLLSSAVNGFQRGLDPQGWQAGQDQAKADKADGVKKQIAMLQNIRALPMEQRMQALPQISQSIGKQIPPELMQDSAIDQHLALLQGEAGIAPSVPEPMSAYEAAQIRLKEQEAAQPQRPITVNNRLVDPSTYEVLGDYSDPEKPQEKVYDTVQLADGVYRINRNDPNDKVRVGGAPVKAGAGGAGKNPNGLTPYQEIQFQYKLDDLDRELAAADKKRNSDLSTVSSSIALLDQFTGDKDTFNEVYGNWVNPTGEGNDLFNPRVQPGSKRANGMAILEQLGGRAFLDSIGAMRGTGPLSDREGARVAAAATRLTNVTQGDEAALKAAQEFRQALISYQNALQQDIANSRQNEAARRRQMEMMLGRQSSAPQTAAPQVQTGQQSGGSVVNPLQATGDAMRSGIQQAIFGAVNSRDDGMDSYIDSLFPTAGADELPAGVTPEEWDAMTPEEQALFQ